MFLGEDPGQDKAEIHCLECVHQTRCLWLDELEARSDIVTEKDNGPVLFPSNVKFVARNMTH